MMRRPLTVVHFCNTLARGGAEEHILGLLRKLDREQFRLHLVCTPELAERMRRDLPADVGLLSLTFRDPWQCPAALRLARFLRRSHADILHIHQFHASVLASPVGRLLAHVPVVIETPHLRECWRTGWKAHYGIDRFFGRCVDHYICVSHANARYLQEVKQFPARKMTVIQNGTDLSRFDPAYQPAPGFRAALGIGNDPLLLMLARLEKQKGHEVLIDAMEIVHRVFPSVKVFCIGEGSLRAELESRAAALGLEETVRFPGHCSNVRDWLAIAEFTILPSFFEGLPLAAVESLAAGKTVVATAVDGTPEIIVDGRTGITVPPGDRVALATAIQRLLAEPTLRGRLAAEGRRWVLEHFDEDGQVARTGELYVRLYGGIRT